MDEGSDSASNRMRRKRNSCRLLYKEEQDRQIRDEGELEKENGKKCRKEKKEEEETVPNQEEKMTIYREAS